jgi:hypothetical protein
MAEELAMSVSVNNRRTRLRSALSAVLTVLILVPTAILFTRVWGDVTDKQDSTRLEQQGVEYIATLAPLVSSLAEAQSSALAGLSAAPGSLTAAVDGVAAADQRLGDALGTRERWSDLREKIQKLPTATDSPLVVFQAHVEVTDLTLALYDTVRDNSELIRDPDNDVSHLQQAIAADLPGAVVQVSRMGDLSKLVAESTPQVRAQLTPQLGGAVQAANATVNSLTDNLQAAVDVTGSTTLSGELVSGLDSFRRGVESLTRGANVGGLPNTATMATAQSQLQVSLSNLSGIVSREMTGLLEDRIDDLGYQELVALAAAVAAVLLTIAAIAVWLLGADRRTAEPTPAEDDPATTDPARGDLGASAPAFGEANPTRRERSGALR